MILDNLKLLSIALKKKNFFFEFNILDVMDNIKFNILDKVDSPNQLRSSNWQCEQNIIYTYNSKYLVRVFLIGFLKSLIFLF